MKRQIYEAIQKLNRWGCDYLVVACNTVHYFFSDIQSWSSGKVLNLVELSSQRASENGKKVGLLASSGLTQAGLYQDALQKRGVEPIVVCREGQQTLDRAIDHAIGGCITDDDRMEVGELIQSLSDRGAETIIIGCTELPMVVSEELSIPVVDAGRVAMEEALRIIS